MQPLSPILVLSYATATGSLIRFLLSCLVLAVGLLGCAVIPQKEFEVYRSNFNAAKAATEDVLLQAKNAAEKTAKLKIEVAAGPNASEDLSEEDPQAELAQRIAALDARIEALNLIAEYNALLVGLASGEDPAALKASLQNLNDGLASFGVSKVASFAAKLAGPLGGLISQGVGIIDKLIREQKFRDAAIAAKPLILGIIELLQADADNIQQIQIQLITLKRDPEETKLQALKKRLDRAMESYKDSDALQDVRKAYVRQVARLKVEAKSRPDFKLTRMPSGTAAATNAEIEVLKGLVDEFTNLVDSYNAFGDQMAAGVKVISQYKTLLGSVGNSFDAMTSAATAPRRDALISVVNNGLAMRKAVLAYQETKQK
jgi:hypothetical protein